MQVASRSEQGSLPVNEDACLALKADGLFLVCDGLSAKSGGEIAASLALEFFTAWRKEAAPFVESFLKNPAKESLKVLEKKFSDAFQIASKGIFQAASQDPALHGMCTGVDAILLLGSHALVGHVGAGRVYLVRQEEAHLLTEDHTQLASLRRSGKLGNPSASEIASLSRKLTRAVGFQEDVKADILLVELQIADRFVVMTDGVWQVLGDSTTFALAAQPAEAEDLVKNLLETVDQTGARDNFTALVLDPDVVPSDLNAGADQKIKLLGSVPAFEFLSYQELMRVIGMGELVKVKAGEFLCKEGAAGEEMMLILQGSLEVKKSGKLIRRLEKGDVFGEMSLIDAAPRSASVVSATPTNLLAFSRSTIFTLIQENNEIGVKLLWGISMELNKRLRTVSNKLVGKEENEGAAPKSSSFLPFQRNS